MKRFAVLIAVVSLFPFAAASAGSIRFDGETYEKKFTNDNPEIRLAEYVRRDESVNNWTKLIAVRNFTKLTEPKAAAANLAKVLQQQNPHARFQLLASKDGSEAQIDFLTWAENADSMEFNIHRYLKVGGYPGLISFQFAYRLTDKSPKAMEAFKRNRQRWISEMSKARFEIDFSR